MASFIGKKNEFKRFIGPYIRIDLIKKITKSYKAKIGQCQGQDCGEKKDLQIAHIRGRSRKELIDLILKDYSNNAVITVDLKTFEIEFIKAHQPLEKNILILCSKCHKEYDKHRQTYSHKSNQQKEKNIRKCSDYLPITLDPSDPKRFKQIFLKSREAEIIITYRNGIVTRKYWHAKRFSSSSDVFRNLRSRHEFRSGVWQKNGIVKVHVKTGIGKAT